MMIYPNAEEFYNARGGVGSDELDFGVWWKGVVPFPRYRLSVVHNTGDLYAIDQSRYEVELLATFGPPKAACNARNHSNCGWERAETILKGWAAVCGTADSLGWVRQQILLERKSVSSVTAS